MKKTKNILPLIIAIVISSCQNEDLIQPVEVGSNKSVLFGLQAQLPMINPNSSGDSRGKIYTEDVFQETFTTVINQFNLGFVTKAIDIVEIDGLPPLSYQLANADLQRVGLSDFHLLINTDGFVAMNFPYVYGSSEVNFKLAKASQQENTAEIGVFMYFDKQGDNLGAGWHLVSIQSTNQTNYQNISLQLPVKGATAVAFLTTQNSGIVKIDDLEIDSYSSGNCTGVDTPQSSSRDDNMGMGNPTGANPNDDDNYLVEHIEANENVISYAYSYNNTRGLSNWVSWHLSQAWMGNQTGPNTWASDPSLSQNFIQATNNDYSGSNFDKGHLCKDKDRGYSSDINESTYHFPNCFPQNPAFNRNDSWKDLENYISDILVETGNHEVYQLAGSFGNGGYAGYGNIGLFDFLGQSQVVVPSHAWKAILILPSGTEDICRASLDNAYMIGYYAQNMDEVDNNFNEWDQIGNANSHVVSIDELELLLSQETGLNYDFFSNLPDNVEDFLEAQVYPKH